MRWRDSRRRAGAQTLEQLTQSVCPAPVGSNFLEEFPAAGRVLPEFVAVRVPIVSEHLDGAGAAVNLQCGRTVLLKSEAGGDDAEAGVRKVEKHLRVVLGFDRDIATVDLPFGDRDAGHGHDAFGRTEQAGQARDAINAKVEEATAARFVEPFAPPRT